jgi:hypothetical protein
MSDDKPAGDAQAALIGELARVSRLHAARRAEPALAGALARIGEWQARRLRNTYADLAVDPRYMGAIAFFQNDLYGGADFSRRDADLVRVVPAMVRLLPEAVIETVARAVELNALSHELDVALLARLPSADGVFNVAEYCAAYRAAGDYPGRDRQRTLIGQVGAGLDRYVRTPMLGTALTMLRRPAKLAGLAALQDFLERGFAAFQRMNGADDFLETVAARETRIHDAIVSGANDPFPEPWPAQRR